MLLRTSLSSIFEGLQRREIGRYEAGSVGDLLGLSMGITLAVFQMLGMVLCCMEWLKMLVSALMACGPRCLRCMWDMPSGPVEEVCFVECMASWVMAGVKGGGKVLLLWSVCRFLMISRSSLRGRSLHVAV